MGDWGRGRQLGSKGRTCCWCSQEGTRQGQEGQLVARLVVGLVTGHRCGRLAACSSAASCAVGHWGERHAVCFARRRQCTSERNSYGKPTRMKLLRCWKFHTNLAKFSWNIQLMMRSTPLGAFEGTDSVSRYYITVSNAIYVEERE